MAEPIRPLTTDSLRSSARAAAEQRIPLAEANHFEPGSRLWLQFNDFYRQHADQAVH